MTQQGSETARYKDTPPLAASGSPASSTEPSGPNLLLEWDSRPRSFFQNLFDILLFRKPEQPVITAKPAKFWSDVFVDQRVSARALFDSALVHVFMVFVIVGFTETYIRWRPAELHDSLAHTKLTYYAVSEYLPEVLTNPQPVTAPRKAARPGLPEAPADPTYAKQEIISVPPDPDNLKQTVVTPSKLRIDRDVPLPNIVTAQPPKAIEAFQVANTPAPKLELPPEIAAPRMKISMSAPEILDASVPKPVEVMNVANRPEPKSLTPPEQDAPKLQIGMKLPEVATGAVPKAAPTPMQVANGRVRKAATPPQEVAAPHIQGSVAAPTIATNGATQLPKPASAAPASTTNGAGNDRTSSQQIIALSTHPTSPNGTLSVPEGSRRGTFAAGPNGSADATGAPATSVEKAGAGGNAANAPAGIHVSAADSAPRTGVVASGTPAPSEELKNRMTAAASAASVPPARVGAEAKTDNDATARAVFGEKRYYKLTVNMPNLTSASGSWVIRFAELHPRADQSQIALAAPTAISKSDPAYPPDLIKDKVEGTVTLYAVIRADGSITDVKVLNSVNQRLDESAVAALHRWRFHPGSKENQAVDVEAVVQVPFKVKKLAF